MRRGGGPPNLRWLPVSVCARKKLNSIRSYASLSYLQITCLPQKEQPRCPLSSRATPTATPPRSAAASASQRPTATSRPSPTSAAMPSACFSTEDRRIEPAPRPRLWSVVVGSLDQLGETMAASSPAAPPKKVHFSFAPPKKVRFSFTPPSQPAAAGVIPRSVAPKSCLKSSGERRNTCSNGRAPSQADLDRPKHASVTPGHHSSTRLVTDEDGWSTVVRRRGGRSGGSAQADSWRPAAPAFLEFFRGKCFRCLAGGHRAAGCREPVRCLRCLRIGHKARECSGAVPHLARQASAAHKHPPGRGTPAPSALARPPPPDPASFPPLQHREMPAPGHPTTRPSEISAVAAATQDMEEWERLSSCTVVLCLCREVDVEPTTIEKELRVRFGIRRGDVKVTRHRPEDFLAVFEYPHHRDAAVALKCLRLGSLNIRIRPWRVLPYSDHRDLRHHVRLCLEGIPAHAWNASIAKRVVASACDMDYVEPQSLRRDDTRALCMWAWTCNPSDIPKVTWLTITGKAVQVHDGIGTPHGRRGLTFRVLVHLDILELPPDSHGRSETRDFTWNYGVVDGGRPLPDSKLRRCHQDENDNTRRARRGNNHSSRTLLGWERSEKRHQQRVKSPDGRCWRNQRSSSPGPDDTQGQGHLNSLLPVHRASPLCVTDCVQPPTQTPSDHVHQGGSSMQTSAMETAQESPAQEVAPLANGAPRATPNAPSPSSSSRSHTREATLDNLHSIQRSNLSDNDSRSPPPISCLAPQFHSVAASSRLEASADFGQEQGDLVLPHTSSPATPRFSPCTGHNQGVPQVCSVQCRRFRPGCVYIRRHPRRQRTPQTVTSAQLALQNATATFISQVTQPTPAPLLQAPLQQPRPPRPTRRGIKISAQRRKSVRIATTSWPQGDAQAKARQVLMKKLGIMEEQNSMDDTLLNYFRLFSGPLSELVIKALTALCGLDGGAAASSSPA